MRALALLACLALLLSGCASESSPPIPEDPDKDTDGDGFTDAFEKAQGSDPKNATSIPDIRVRMPVDFSGSGTIVGDEVVGTGQACGGRVAQDTATFTWSITAPQNATGIHVTGLTFTITLSATLIEADIAVFDPTGALITAPTTMTIPPSKTDTATADGTFSAGDYRIEVRGCVGAGNIDLVANGVLSYLPDPSTLQ